MSAAREPVSSPDEPLILVDEEDREIGYSSKEDCHRGAGILHRAFSVFLFDREGRLLLQQRSAQKPLWPLYWSNSCCSHPRRSESAEEAAHRRIAEELDVDCELEYLYKFKYQANYGDRGAEHEFCRVYAGIIDGDISPHPDEIADWRFVTPDELTASISDDGDRYTPWLKLEWQRIREDFLDDILAGLA